MGAGRRHSTRNFIRAKKRQGQALGFFLLIIYQIKKKKIAIVSLHPQHFSLPRSSRRENAEQEFMPLEPPEQIPSALQHLREEGQGKGLQAEILVLRQQSGSTAVLSPPRRHSFQTFRSAPLHHPPQSIRGRRKIGLQEVGWAERRPREAHSRHSGRPQSSAAIAHPGSDPLP